MQEDGTFMAGANFLPKAITPEIWDYNTWNYYLNITFLPFMEISYRMTLFKLDGSNHFNNQDRSYSARFRILKEKQEIPSFVLGANDIFWSKQGLKSRETNQFYRNIYLVAGKNIDYNQCTIQTTLGYSLGIAGNEYFSGLFGGVSVSPSFLPQMKLIAEYDTKGVNAGAGMLLFKHLYLYGMEYELKRFAGGFAYLIYLKT